MERRYLRLFVLLASISLASTAYADGYKFSTVFIQHCYQVSNVDEFPDYVFIMFFDRGSSYSHYFYGAKVITPGSCIDAMNTAHLIYAIPKSKISEQDLSTLEAPDSWRTGELVSFVEKTSDLVQGDIEVGASVDLPVYTPVTKIVEVIEISHSGRNYSDIKKIDKSTIILDKNLDYQNTPRDNWIYEEVNGTSGKKVFFELRKAKRIFTYTDGSTEEKPYVSQAVFEEPEPSRVISDEFLLLSLLAFVVIASTILFSKIRRALNKRWIAVTLVLMALYAFVVMRSPFSEALWGWWPLTVAIEACILGSFTLLFFTNSLNWVRPKAFFLYVLLVNLFTWPLGGYAIYVMGVNFFLVELGVVIVEWAILTALLEIKGSKGIMGLLALSFFTNAVSMVLSWL